LKNHFSMKRVNVTITSDASFYRKDKVGGWAFQIRSKDLFEKQFGPLKGHIGDATEAEMKSVLNALYLLKTKYTDLKINILTINVDCEFIVKHMFNKNKKRKFRIKDLTNRISQYLEHIDYAKLNIKHVKAHTEDLSEARKFVNDWCDRHSRLGSFIASDRLQKNRLPEN